MTCPHKTSFFFCIFLSSLISSILLIAHHRFDKILIAGTVSVSLQLDGIHVAGGSVLVWWNVKYRSENSELWMVPFGLILFLTPMVIWFSLIVSDLCVSSSKEDEKFIPGSNRLVHPIDDSVWDPKRWSEKTLTETSSTVGRSRRIQYHLSHLLLT
ncbi:hypothetical protein K1719_026887 [Acacia pycnantha]|nr:hypothetical protein K1719_026887 [Acacia pycnantha]